MKKIINVLISLLDVARTIGLPDHDLNTARNFIEYNEFGLCFDTIITQMYEYDIEIDSEFYILIEKIGNNMKLPDENFSFMKELIRDNSNIPKLVKEHLAKIISSLD